MKHTEPLARALAQLDRDRIAADAARLVRAPSVTGDERPALEALSDLCTEHGLASTLHEHDLAALRAHPDHPGEEAPRDELLGLTATLPGRGPRRLCLDGHLDVVGPGTAPWSPGPWSGAVTSTSVHGRGAVDMKGGVVAALHALSALRAAAVEPPCDVVLLGVASEEDGGLGTFAALEHDDRFDACLIPEPTNFGLVCAHGGALTVRGVVTGVSAHAAFRLHGVSAIDRYLPIHAALAELERRINRDVAHPLMRELELPYPVLVGQLHAGTWSSQVPDRLEFEARVGVPVGVERAQVRRWVEDAVAAAAPGPPVALSWHGGQFGAGGTDPDDPFVRLVAGALDAETGAPARLAGISYGADMRLFTERGIPCAMVGPSDLALAHAVDEHVAIDDLLRAARIIVRVVLGFGA